jgi:two-component sensor histidine kinase
VVVEPKSVGLGTRLIDGFIRHELRGDVALEYRPEGLACRMTVPVHVVEGKA